jgi:SAM-dependent methyltransferase
MEKEAYKQYLEEAEGWLHKGRRYLLGQFIAKVFGSAPSETSNLKILEIGAGCGKSADYLANYGEFQAVEVEETAIEILREDKRICKLYESCIPFELNETYDLVVAMDVIEHIEDDQEAFDWIVERLNPGGFLFVTVPAYQWMFSDHDVALNHFRRYSLGGISSLNRHRLTPLLSTYFNCLLFPLAALSRVVAILKGRNSDELKKQSSKLPSIIDQVFYKILQFESRLIKKGFYFPWGLSVVVAYKKNQE